MIRLALLILCVAAASLALPAELPLLPGALPARTSSKYLPFKEISSGRIISGESAAAGQFPWQAALLLSVPGGTSFCGGSLISSTWILTAAHCVEGVSAAEARLGTIAWNSGSGVAVSASGAVAHANYNGDTLENDIALIQLASSVATSSTIRTIPLATSTLGNGVAVTVSGFGRTSDSSTAVSQTLNFVSLTTISPNQCAQTYGTLGAGVVCATGTTIQSTCGGDSGGPLITGSGTNALHVGTVSFGSIYGCALGYPSGYTRTSTYRQWIQQNSGV